ncbi:MAG: T9SS type A sorting domain-containing protein [Flavobacterium sp.]
MKKITLILVLLSFSLGYSQDLLLGFEAGESGGVNGGPFGGGPAPVVEAGTGSNTTQVLKIVGNPSGEPWQGINLTLTSSVNLTSTQEMTMDVLSDTPITFLVKVTGGTSGPAVVAASATHPGGGNWQTISFTFNTSLDGQGAPATGLYSGFVIHTYWAPGATTFFNPTVPTPERTFYVDNIRGPLGTAPVASAPTTAAPTPPNRPAADVRSLFSDVYDPVTVMGYSGDNNSYNTSWCPATTTLVQIEGNNTNRITGLGCEGIDFQAGRFDATGFTRFHIDIWTATPTQDRVFSFKFSNHNNTTQETNAFEYTATNANILPSGSEGAWISIDIPLTSFNCINTPPGNACPNVTDFVQFVITSDLGTVFYDNLYLHKNTVMSVSSFEKSNIKMFPNPATTNFTIDAEDMLERVVLYNMLGQAVINVTPNNQQANIDISGLQVGVYVVKATVNGVESTTRLVKK